MKRLSKQYIIAFFVLLCVLCMSACNSLQTQKPSDTPENQAGGLTFITGNQQGTYYYFGNAIAGIISESTDTKLNIIPSGGSKENIEALQTGKAQVGFVQSDVMDYALKGINLFEQKADNISVIAELYKEQVQIVTMDSSLKSVDDLKNKNVSIGQHGSGVYFNALDVLGVYGLTERDINPIYQSFSESVNSLKSGKLDAAFIVSGTPTSAVSSLAATDNIYLIGLDDEHIEDLVHLSPYYSREIISGKSYNTPSDIKTVAVSAVLAVRNDVSEDDVYNITSGIFDNLDNLTKAHFRGTELNLEKAASLKEFPYHRGAARYYNEKNIAVSVKSQEEESQK